MAQGRQGTRTSEVERRQESPGRRFDDSVYEQERIAIDYIAANRDGLKALAQAPGVTTFILGLQCHIVLDESTVGFCMRPSAGLMSRALDIGIEPTFYVTLDRAPRGEAKARGSAAQASFGLNLP